MSSFPVPLARRCGATVVGDATHFRVWAPFAGRLDLVLIDGDRRDVVPMARDDDGHFSHVAAGIGAGQRYALSLDGGPDRPDPCSLFQPDDVAGPSEVVAPEAFPWTDHAWRGVEREDLVFYELHVGTFTEAGTFDAAIDRLDDLVALGVTAIEIMPVGQFPGERNWGYDGVLPYAAQHSYGGPVGLMRLVDAAHAKGLAVILDVVYNHFGPEGNYLAEFGPYFTKKYKTPWGDAINYDDKGSDDVRLFVFDNVRMWLDAFHLDGLRLDAVHAIYDLGAIHLLLEIQRVAEEVIAKTGVPRHVIAESDLNDPRIINPRERGGYQLDAQWCDDFHHAVHAFVTGEKRGYYVDYGEAKQLAEALNSPFLGAGEYSRHRGRRHGAPPEGLTGDRFVVCIQNHDQVGNRAIGDRLSAIMAEGEHGLARQRLAAGMMLLAPYLPMLFMGEEYGETRPFPFFCDFEGAELAEAVRQGRRREFADFVDDPALIPDPLARATFESAKLAWQWPDGSHGAGLRRMYGDLLAARRAWPAMRDYEHRSARLVAADGSVIELLRGIDDSRLRAYFNVTAHRQPLPTTIAASERRLFSSADPRYAGDVGTHVEEGELQPFECLVLGPTAWTEAAELKNALK